MKIVCGDCTEKLNAEVFRCQVVKSDVALTFLDPPFNQGKDYVYFDDALPDSDYWQLMKTVCERVRDLTAEGGAIYFMQREKNTEAVLQCLRETGWTLQNLIIWTKRTSAVPSTLRYGKQYQVIAFATKGKRPRVFNRLRIDLPLRPEQKIPREAGVFVTDVWDDIREMTSGYFAGEEALRNGNGERAHKQQAPIALLLRIILSSTMPGDLVLDPFAGTGTTLIVAEQVGRASIGIEIDPKNVKLIQSRLDDPRDADKVLPLRAYYRFTPNLDALWNSAYVVEMPRQKQMALMESKRRYKHGRA